MNYTIMVLAAYAVIMIAATVLMTNKEKNVERFCVGNRNTGWFISALSIAATWIWAPALFTSTENAYTKGFAGLFWFLVPNVLCLIFFIPFARRIRKEMPEGITLSGYMHQKYQSESVKNIYLFQLGALSALSTGVQLLAGSKILSMLTGIPFWIMTVIMAVIAYSYSQFSGIKASILTDSIQMVFMLIASVCFAVFGIKNGGGIQNMFAGIGGYTGECSSLFSAKGIEIFLGFGLPTTVGLISGPFGDQCFWQRAFCAKKNRIGRAFFVGAILFGVVPLSMGILGFVGAGMGYTAIDTGVINFELISELFPSWAVIPFLFMIVSGLLSTIDSNLCAISSLTTDIFKKNTLGKTKVAMVALLAIGIVVANIPGLTVTHLFLMYGTLRAATLQSSFDTFQSPIKKSEKSEQLDPAVNVSASEWIPHRIDMNGLRELVETSTILPQCIKAYKNNIAGFGISVEYIDDIEENEETKAEWVALERILSLLNLDTDTKEVFEKVVKARETFGISYIECIRNFNGEVVEIQFINDTPSVHMTYPQEPYIDMDYLYRGEKISRKRKFRKFKQEIAGKTVYFKEFGDPRIMDKRNGQYVDNLEIDYQANELLDFVEGDGYYGTVRWIGQVIVVDGNYRAELLNNNYFRNGRHTPMMIIVKGGTLSDESFDKLKSYMNDIKGENGQHAFMILETEKTESTADFESGGTGPDIEIKDLANILQKDELFQEYQENGRKKVQSSFLLPDLYTGYTTDFNRATAQTAMEITEKQVFQPERASLAWIVNNKLLNGYGFKYVKAVFDAPDITNPDDIMKILNITERAGGMTMNDARKLTMDTLGLESEDYPEAFNMDDIGNVPLAVIKSMPALYNHGNDEDSGHIDDTAADSFIIGDDVKRGLDEQIEKAERAREDEIVSVMKEVRKTLLAMGGDANA